MSYSVKSIFYTLQGEGAHAGRAAVFLRFAGCNLWSGREADRETAECQFCDTDFIGTDGEGGGRFETASALADAVRAAWPGSLAQRGVVVCTGGEPLLQLDTAAIDALHRSGFDVHVESNGTLPAPRGIDWLCISPKAGCELRQRSGNELKLVYPQVGGEPERYVDLDFEQFRLQPMDSAAGEENTEAALEYCRQHPKWIFSVQLHKQLGIP